MKKCFKWIAAILIVASIFSFMGCPNEPELPSGNEVISSGFELGEVKDLFASAIDGNAVVIWTNPTLTEFAGVEISMSPAEGSLTEPVKLEKDVNFYDVTGLEMGKEYEFTVRAYDTSNNYTEGMKTKTTVKTVPAINTEDNIVLTVWESAYGPDDFIQRAGEEFTKKYPNITIKFKNVESNDAAQQIMLDGPAGVGADVFCTQHDQIGKLVTNGNILPVANPNNIVKSLLSLSNQGSRYKGTMYAYPVSTETYALYYNKALISEEEIPKNWEDLATWSAKFSKKNPGKIGLGMDVGNSYYAIIFASGYGNRLFGESGTDFTSSYLNTPEAIKGMEVFQNLRKVGLDVPAQEMKSSIVDASFTSGIAAMAISGPWNSRPYANAGINYGVAPLPSMPGETTPSASFAGVRNMYVSAYSKHPVEAAAFAEFLLSEEMQKLRYEITGALPAVKVDLDDSVAQGFLKQLDYAYPMRYGLQMDKFWEAFGATASNIWNGADVRTELDAVDAAIIN